MEPGQRENETACRTEPRVGAIQYLAVLALRRMWPRACRDYLAVANGRGTGQRRVPHLHLSHHYLSLP